MSDPTHVLLHGVPGAADEWSRVISLLPVSRVLAIELPDHGVSPQSDLDAFGLVDFVEARLRETTGELVLVGCSFGAWAALHLADRLRPRVRRVVGIGALGRVPEDAAAMRRELLEQVRTQSMDPATLGELVLPLLVGSAPPEQARVQLGGMLSGISGQQWERHLLRALDLARPEAEITQVDVPLSLLHGREDAAVPLALGLELAERASQARVDVIETDAHVLHLTHPERVVAAIVGP